MRRTLLLCFIHGFKGGADTFGAGSQFAQDLRQQVAAALPRVDVRVAVYPPYDTRGDLAATVARFLDWLLEQVIDLEVAARTPSPTVDPSVHCVLIGHSMGGIVAADALLALAGDKRVGEPEEAGAGEGEEAKKTSVAAPEFNSLLFPYVQGVLGFDTPYLGIAPGVVAYTAEDRYTQASAALAQVSTLTDALWGGKGKAAAAGGGSAARGQKALPAAAAAAAAASSADSAGAGTAAAAPGTGWGWGKVAVAGALASGAAAAAGLAAYRQRDQLTQGWQWATSHLEFVGCLARGAVLRARMARLAAVQRALGVGFANLYTQLGRKAKTRPAGAPRTFCNLPAATADNTGAWRVAVNDAATDEAGAHMSMFEAAHNPNYGTLVADARTLIVRWTADTEWYRDSAGANTAASRRNSSNPGPVS